MSSSNSAKRSATDATRLHRVEPGSKVRLASHDPGDTSHAPGDKAATVEAIEPLAVRLAELQARLWARSKERVLVVLQGLDTSGKGGTVEHVLGRVHPVGLKVVSFKAPTAIELSHDYLWRVHAEVPAAGELGVFDRSYYEDVLVVRVEELVPKERWERRYEDINAFERLLVDEGTTVVKVFLHISREEQKERLQARLDNPAKQWKFRRDDLVARSKWDEYEKAFEDMLERTSTKHAPWYLIPSDHKWYRSWAVASILVATMEGLDVSWPKPAEDLSGIVIPD
jgi:PPK2 family polyphosphate:nucleotide phosphotransferase